jgi:hypothetical protein
MPVKTVPWLKPIFKFYRGWPTAGWETAARSAFRVVIPQGNRASGSCHKTPSEQTQLAE